MIKLLKLVLYWAPRLPWKFTVPFLLLMIVWLAVVSAALKWIGLSAMADVVAWLIGLPYLGKEMGGGVPGYLTVTLRVFLEGLVAVLILTLVLLLSYNGSVLFYRRIRGRPEVKIHEPVALSERSQDVLEEFKRQRNLDELRIGIILAGGGAKGAYQAGTMKAVHEFLEINHALASVRMIAGTSIGSWNAMFWLAGLIKSPGQNQPSAHEQWWRSIKVERIMEFETYFPLAQNYFFNTRPWQEMFEDMFVETPAVQSRLNSLFYSPRSTGGGRVPIHFYFTRSNVEQGHLEFATNNIMLPNIKRPKWRTSDPNDTEPIVPGDQYELIENRDGALPLERLKLAVFASMDLPPLFPYMLIRTQRGEWFEDGGVVDNLPLRFGTEIEECNLLFVLPLNASFEEKANHSSMIRRLFRVMDVRQGVLERNSIKMARLYNDRARLIRQLLSRETATTADQVSPAPTIKPLGSKEHLKFARSRVVEPVSVFAICPEQPLDIGTAEFWKPAEAGQAFDLMYSTTKVELEENFLEATDPDAIRMTLVSPHGGRSYVYDF